MGDFSKTLNLLKTDFPMKGNLGQREVEWLSQFKKINIYNKIRNSKKGKKKFISVKDAIFDLPKIKPGEGKVVCNFKSKIKVFEY